MLLVPIFSGTCSQVGCAGLATAYQGLVQDSVETALMERLQLQGPFLRDSDPGIKDLLGFAPGRAPVL